MKQSRSGSGDMYAKGNIYEDSSRYTGVFPADCLGRSEIEYHDAHSHSIYVKFTVTDGKGCSRRMRW